MLDALSRLFAALSPLWEMSLTGAFAAAVVLLLRLALKRRAPRQAVCLLWLIVFARLLLPVSLESPFSAVPQALTDVPAAQEAEVDTPSLPQPGAEVPGTIQHGKPGAGCPGRGR